EFLERARLTIAEVGMQLGPPSGVPPMDFCLRILLRELVCERESLNNPPIARLNSDQLGRYLWAPYSGDSITPDSGQVLNVCEALKWYCQRLIGLVDSPDVVLRINGCPAKTSIEKSNDPQKSAEKRGRRPDQKRREAIRSAISKHGDRWRDYLSEIFTELDSQEVPLGDFGGRKIDLGDGDTETAWKWGDLDFAAGEQLKQIIDALRKYAE